MSPFDRHGRWEGRLPIKSLVVAVALAAVPTVSAFAASADNGCKGYTTSGKAVDEIRVLEEDGGQSNVTGLTLEQGKRMFAESFVSYGPDGAIKSRDDVFRTFVGGRMPAWASSFSIKDLQVKVYCDTATAVGLAEVTAKAAPAGTPPLHFRWLNVWAKPEGFWQIVASQFTPVKLPQAK